MCSESGERCMSADEFEMYVCAAPLLDCLCLPGTPAARHACACSARQDLVARSARSTLQPMTLSGVALCAGTSSRDHPPRSLHASRYATRWEKAKREFFRRVIFCAAIYPGPSGYESRSRPRFFSRPLKEINFRGQAREANGIVTTDTRHRLGSRSTGGLRARTGELPPLPPCTRACAHTRLPGCTAWRGR